MNLNNVFVVDIECDGLLDDLSKLHILSAGWKSPDGSWAIKSTNKVEDIAKIFSNPNNTIVGHFFLGYDIRAIKQLFPQIEVKASIIDTIGLSYYLYNSRKSHGLEDWGSELGFEKVKVEKDEWKTLSYELAKERCEGDVNINILVWEKMLKLLRELYSDDDAIISVIKRSNFKIELLNIQSENKILVDIEQCQKNLDFLQGIVDEKVKEVEAIMPGVPVTQDINKPAKLTKKDGSPSAAAVKWFGLLKENGVREDFDGTLTLTKSYDPPNVSSSKQMKDFLFSKGWKPAIYGKGTNGPVPQLRDADKNLCKSVLKLVKVFPELEALQGLSVAQHRSGYLKAFLSLADKDGYITASWSGMAKTWRVKHVKPICNLPGNGSQYGELVRAVLIAPKGKVFVNADLSSLEDKTKQVCISPIDPDYVATMNTEGYDAHLNIGLSSGFLTQEEVDFFKWYKSKERNPEELPSIYRGHSEEELSLEFKRVSKIRSSAKTVNYAATYGASPQALAASADISLKEAKVLHKTYWDVNWSVKKFADSLAVKEVDGRNWIYSPYSRTWLLLTSDHIKFSAVNQNFGAAVFDLLLWFLIKAGIKPIMTVHDELSYYIDEGMEEDAERIVQESIDKVNKVFNFPIKFEAGPEFATSYGNVH